MRYPATLAGKKKLYNQAKDQYYNDDAPGMTDAEFDRLEDLIREEDPTWDGLKKTGAPVRGALATKKAKKALPHYMPSLAKCYPEQWAKWVRSHPSARGQYLVMDKLDGSSVYLEYRAGNPVYLSTRGNGEVGGDISFLIPKLDLPRNIKDKSTIELRCEAVVKRKVFAKKWASKFDNARQMANGLLNRTLSKTDDDALWDVDIVVVGRMGFPIGDQLSYLAGLGFKVVNSATARLFSETPEGMSGLLAFSKKASPYEIDGLVIVPTGTKMVYEDSDKPGWAVAFKTNVEDDAPVVKVLEVVWQLSQRGRITPKIKIAPTEMDGVTVTAVTAHNPAWMVEHGIGPGATVKVLRSGGVIPKIVGVVKPAKFVPPPMPHKKAGRFFVLDESAAQEHHAGVEVKALVKFLGTLGVEYLAEKTIQVLYDKGCRTPFHYMKVAKTRNVEALRRAGLGKVQSQNIVNELVRAFTNTSLLKLMVASNKFGVGVGERRLEAIQATGLTLTQLVNMSDAKARETLVAISGFKDKTAATVIEGLTPFRRFYMTAEKYITIKDEGPKPKKTARAGGALSGKTFSFTGYRSKDQEAAIEAAGGLVVPFSLSKTQVLLVTEGGKASTKADKARDRSIKVCSFSDLRI